MAERVPGPRFSFAAGSGAAASGTLRKDLKPEVGAYLGESEVGAYLYCEEEWAKVPSCRPPLPSRVSHSALAASEGGSHHTN